jgi:hypothetical protein
MFPMSSFADIAKEAQNLNPEEKRDLMDLLHQWLIEERRDEIREQARQSRLALEQGKTRRGDLNDLLADLYAEDQ